MHKKNEITFYSSRHFFDVLLFAMLLLFVFNLMYIQEAYPLKTIAFSGGYLIIALLAFYGVFKAGIVIPQTLSVALLIYAALLIFMFERLKNAPVEALGNPFFINILQGFWVFLCVGFIKVGADKTCEGSLRIQGKKSKEDAAAKPVLLMKMTPESIIALFFIVTAALLSAHGIFQRVYGFQRQYEILKSNNFFEHWDTLSGGIEYALMQKRIFSTFGNPNIFACFLSISLPIIFAAILLVRGKNIKAFGAMCLIMLLAASAIVLTKSRGGMLTAALGLANFFILLNPIKNKYRAYMQSIIFLLIFIPFIFILFLLKPEAGDVRKDGASKEASSALVKSGGSSSFKLGEQNSLRRRFLNLRTVKERFYYLSAAKQMISESPFIGNGLGAFEAFYSRCKHPLAFESKYAHNFFFQMIAEIGAAGFIFFFLWMLAVFKAAVSWINSSSSKEDIFIRAGILSAAVVVIINGLMEYSFYSREIYLAFCLLCGVCLSPKGTQINEDSKKEKLSLHRIALPLILTIFALSATQYPARIYPVAMGNFYSYYGDTAIRDEHNYEVAKQYYLKAVKFDKTMPWHWARLSNADFALGENDDGFANLGKAIELNKYSASLEADLADYYLQRKMYPDAIGAIGRAINNYPTASKYHEQRAKILNEAGETEGAIESLRSAVKFSLDDKLTKKYADELQALESIKNQIKQH